MSESSASSVDDSDVDPTFYPDSSDEDYEIESDITDDIILFNFINNQDMMYICIWKLDELWNWNGFKFCVKLVYSVYNCKLELGLKGLIAEETNQKQAESLLSIDERKRPYNSMYEVKKPTEKEIEAYHIKRRRDDDPMNRFF